MICTDTWYGAYLVIVGGITTIMFAWSIYYLIRYWLDKQTKKAKKK